SCCCSGGSFLVQQPPRRSGPEPAGSAAAHSHVIASVCAALVWVGSAAAFACDFLAERLEGVRRGLRVADRRGRVLALLPPTAPLRGIVPLYGRAAHLGRGLHLHLLLRGAGTTPHPRGALGAHSAGLRGRRGAGGGRRCRSAAPANKPASGVYSSKYPL